MRIVVELGGRMCPSRRVGQIALVTLLLFMSGCAAKQTSTPPGNETPALSGDMPALPDTPGRLARIERDKVTDFSGVQGEAFWRRGAS
ncbi:MAG: hypothetical protein QOJ54_555 [Aliidongia sp.]|jgi:hypothetical protein|nr:hypothetical protein [Aliidongia sp.]